MTNLDRVDIERCKLVFKNKMLRLMPEQGEYHATFGGVRLFREDNDSAGEPMLYKPVIIVVAQGRKCVKLGAEDRIYKPGSYFVTGIDLPTMCGIQGASSEEPYLAFSLELDSSLIAQATAEMPLSDSNDECSLHVTATSTLEPGFFDAVLRLVELIERPEQVGMLAPLIIKEIHYRLMIGPYGKRLRSLNANGLPANQIAKAIFWLKENFTRPLIVADMAKQANMAVSTFHKYFKNVTAMSPLQYQKRLRLIEAHKLMLASSHDACRASQAVGYDNQQQFNREYKRLFGEPPHRNISRMRGRTLPVREIDVM